MKFRVSLKKPSKICKLVNFNNYPNNKKCAYLVDIDDTFFINHYSAYTYQKQYRSKYQKMIN